MMPSMPVARVSDQSLCSASLSAASISGDKSVRGGRTLACQASSRARRSTNGKPAQVLILDEQRIVETHVRRKLLELLAA